MRWAGRQHPVETLTELVAPIPLALALGWSSRALGFSIVEAAAIAVLSLSGGFAIIRRSGEQGHARPFAFEPAGFDAGTPELDELLLGPADELLELTDPLIEVGTDSRVVRLFERQEPTPGELVDRITDFLGEGKRPAIELAAADGQAGPVDASAALHAALANIRASLR